jgi:hypothetical protein
MMRAFLRGMVVLCEGLYPDLEAQSEAEDLGFDWFMFGFAGLESESELTMRSSRALQSRVPRKMNNFQQELEASNNTQYFKEVCRRSRLRLIRVEVAQLGESK